VDLAWLSLPPDHRNLLEEVDIAAGGRLLERAPAGIRENIRSAGYRSMDYTHEIVAETYALMMARLVRGYRDKPIWLHDEIYNLLTRVTGWNG